MRPWNMVLACLACAALVGCQENAPQARTGTLDVELVNTLANVMMENALITQHTLYPYHFVTDGEMLNDLGRRDLGVLARHYAEHPGVLNIRRDQTPEALYDARVAHVMAGLKEAGVRTERMNVSDEMAGGPGMPSEQVVTILHNSASAGPGSRREAITR